MHLLKQHIKRKTKDQDQSQFTEEIINEFGLFILHRVIPGLATCTTLENALKQEKVQTSKNSEASLQLTLSLQRKRNKSESTFLVQNTKRTANNEDDESDARSTTISSMYGTGTIDFSSQIATN